MRLRTGWFSDRSATYLAAGRPVITQDTGFGNVLPTGEGLFAFDSLGRGGRGGRGDRRRLRAPRRAAARDRARVLQPRGRARRAARRRSASARRERARRQRPASVFPPELDLEPVSPPPDHAAARDGRGRAARRRSRPTRTRRRWAPASASIVVVTHDDLAFTRLCLESVLANTADARLRADRRRQRLDRRHAAPTCAELAERDARVRVLLNGRNMGFAPACNQGLGLAGGEHLVLLNNDTIVPPGWLAGLLRAPARPRRRPGRAGHEPDRQRGRDRRPTTAPGASSSSSPAAAAGEHAGRVARDADADDVLPGDAPRDLPAPRAARRALRGRPARGRRLRRARPRGRLPAALRRGRRRPPLRRGLVRQARRRRRVRAHPARRTSGASSEKWGQPWEPYGRRPNPRYEREAEQLREAVDGGGARRTRRCWWSATATTRCWS